MSTKSKVRLLISYSMVPSPIMSMKLVCTTHSHHSSKTIQSSIIAEKLGCFSFDDAHVDTAVVLDTSTGHILLERIYTIEHVTAINSSAHHEKHPLSPNTIVRARPFDEFASDSNTSTGASGSSNDNTTKSD